jgi:ABC-type glycerol-3-phosphate transport system permease component
MSRGALGVLAVLTFLESWNAYLWPSIVLRSPENYTLPIGLASLDGMFQIEYGMMLAGGLLATLPVILLFVVGGKSLLDNISAGAVKG